MPFEILPSSWVSVVIFLGQPVAETDVCWWIDAYLHQHRLTLGDRSRYTATKGQHCVHRVILPFPINTLIELLLGGGASSEKTYIASLSFIILPINSRAINRRSASNEWMSTTPISQGPMNRSFTHPAWSSMFSLHLSPQDPYSIAAMHQLLERKKSPTQITTTCGDLYRGLANIEYSTRNSFYCVFTLF